MAVNVRHREGVTILKLDGKIFGPAALEFKKAFDEQIDSCTGTPKFLVDFAGVTIMGSSGLGALTGAYVSVEKKGGASCNHECRHKHPESYDSEQAGRTI